MYDVLAVLIALGTSMECNLYLNSLKYSIFKTTFVTFSTKSLIMLKLIF